MILIPICHHQHWILIAANVKKQIVMILNSIENSVTKNYLFTHFKFKVLKLVLYNFRKYFDKFNWNLSDQKSIPQIDDYNCGLYLMIVIFLIFKFFRMLNILLNLKISIIYILLHMIYIIWEIN